MLTLVSLCSCNECIYHYIVTIILCFIISKVALYFYHNYSSPPIFTLAVCTILKTPDNGALILTGTSHGNTATYTCDTGFALVGSETLSCGEDGMWSDPPPVCQRVVGMESNTFILLTILCEKRYLLIYFLPTTAVSYY